MSKEVNYKRERRKRNERKEHLFEKCVDYYQHALGVYDYEITVYGEYIDDRAILKVDRSGGVATIAYSIEWLERESTTERSIDKTAFHEVFELSFEELKELLLVYYSFTYVEGLIHKQIRRGECVLWPLLSKIRKGELNGEK
jgi:hypothetical protein